MKDIAYWIAPNGDEHDVAGKGSVGFAMGVLDALEAETDNPVLNLLRRGWAKVSQDTIYVSGLDTAKRSRIRCFLKFHVPQSEPMYLADEQDDSLARLDGSWWEFPRR